MKRKIRTDHREINYCLLIYTQKTLTNYHRPIYDKILDYVSSIFVVWRLPSQQDHFIVSISFLACTCTKCTHLIAVMYLPLLTGFKSLIVHFYSSFANKQNSNQLQILKKLRKISLYTIVSRHSEENLCWNSFVVGDKNRVEDIGQSIRTIIFRQFQKLLHRRKYLKKQTVVRLIYF